jgi:hypothetical protein
MIMIPPMARGTTLGHDKAVSTEEYWLGFYRTHDESAADLKDKVTLLNLNHKTRDVQAILSGYLTYHSRNAEPWMYEALALAIQMNRGNTKDIKAALGYAATLAERDKNPNLLISVADLMFLHGFYDRVGTLLDEAAEKVPHRAEPLMMSINLAQKTKDPERMARSVDQLLSLGWPGDDERIRRDARLQAENLAQTLREDGRANEADALLNRLPEIEARDLYVRLTWTGNAGLDLVVKEPLGATARPLTPRTVFGGSIVKDGYGKHPEDIYVCPRGFDGDYTISVETMYNDPEKPATHAMLEIISHEGTPEEHKEKRNISLGKTAPAPVVIHLTGGRRTTVMPFLSPTTVAAEFQAALKRQAAAAAAKKAAHARKGASKADAANPLGRQGDPKSRPQ